MLASQYTKKTHTHARRSAPKKSSKYRSRKKQNQKQCSGAATKNRKPNENFIFLDLSSFMIVHFRWCHWLCCVVLLFWICMPPVLVRRRSKEGFFFVCIFMGQCERYPGRRDVRTLSLHRSKHCRTMDWFEAHWIRHFCQMICWRWRYYDLWSNLAIWKDQEREKKYI